LGAAAVAHAARPEPAHPEPVAKPSPAAPAEPPAPEPVPDAPDTPEAAEVNADEAHPHVDPPSAFGQTEVLKHAYDTQSRDPLWATDAESKIGGLFASKDMPAGMLQGASCRRAVCRIELNWSSEHAAAFLRVYQGVIQEFGTDLAMQPLPAEEGAVNQRLDLYLTRKGYTVADLSK
jgi:hypothetical protein